MSEEQQPFNEAAHQDISMSPRQGSMDLECRACGHAATWTFPLPMPLDTWARQVMAHRCPRCGGDALSIRTASAPAVPGTTKEDR